jgi:uncharacterized protein YukE
MADYMLLVIAREAEELAELCEHSSFRLDNLEEEIAGQMERLFASHRGVTPENLRENYFSWKSKPSESSHLLQQVSRACREQARIWYAEFEEQLNEEDRNSNEQEQKKSDKTARQPKL